MHWSYIFLALIHQYIDMQMASVPAWLCIFSYNALFLYELQIHKPPMVSIPAGVYRPDVVTVISIITVNNVLTYYISLNVIYISWM